MIKDGISFLALVTPMIWCLWHRAWWALLGYFAVLFAITGIGMLAGFGDIKLGLLTTLLNVGFALEANNIRRWMLENAGAVMVGVTSGGNLEECEYRFFTSWLKTAKEEPSAPSLQGA